MSSIQEAGTALPKTVEKQEAPDFKKSLEKASRNKSGTSETTSEAQQSDSPDADEVAVETLTGKLPAGERVRNVKRSRQLLNHYFPEVSQKNFPAKKEVASQDNAVKHAGWSDLGKPDVAVGGITPGPKLQQTGWKQGFFDLVSTDGNWTHTAFASNPIPKAKRGNVGLGYVGSYTFDGDLKSSNGELGIGATRIIRSKSGQPKGLLWANLRGALGNSKSDPDTKGLPPGGHYASINFGIAFSPTYALKKGTDLGAKVGKIPTPQTVAVKAALIGGGKALQKSNDYATPWVGAGWRGVMNTDTGDIYVKGKKFDVEKLVQGTFFDSDSEEQTSAEPAGRDMNHSDVILADANADRYYSALSSDEGSEFNDKIGMTKEVFRDLSFAEAAQSGRKPAEVMRDLSEDLVELKEYYDEARDSDIAPSSALSYSRAVQRGVFQGGPEEWHELTISRKLTDI